MHIRNNPCSADRLPQAANICRRLVLSVNKDYARLKAYRTYWLALRSLFGGRLWAPGVFFSGGICTIPLNIPRLFG